ETGAWQSGELIRMIAEHVQVIRVARAAAVHRRGCDARNLPEQPCQIRRVAFPGPGLFLEVPHLGEKQAALELGQPEVRAASTLQTGAMASAGVVVEGIA